MKNLIPQNVEKLNEVQITAVRKLHEHAKSCFDNPSEVKNYYEVVNSFFIPSETCYHGNAIDADGVITSLERYDNPPANAIAVYHFFEDGSGTQGYIEVLSDRKFHKKVCEVIANHPNKCFSYYDFIPTSLEDCKGFAVLNDDTLVDVDESTDLEKLNPEAMCLISNEISIYRRDEF